MLCCHLKYTNQYPFGKDCKIKSIILTFILKMNFHFYYCVIRELKPQFSLDFSLLHILACARCLVCISVQCKMYTMKLTTEPVCLPLNMFNCYFFVIFSRCCIQIITNWVRLQGKLGRVVVQKIIWVTLMVIFFSQGIFYLQE